MIIFALTMSARQFFIGLVLVQLGFLSVPTYASKFLMLVGDAPSHVSYNGRMASALANRGHSITFITSEAMPIPKWIGDIPNVTLMSYNMKVTLLSKDKSYTQPLLDSALNPSLMRQKDSVFNNIKRNMDYGFWLLNDTALLERLDSANFDFVIVDMLFPPWAVIPHRLGLPSAILGITCMPIMRRVPLMPSYVPHITSTFTPEMVLKERLVNFILYALEVSLMASMDGMDLVPKYAPGRGQLELPQLLQKSEICIEMRDTVVDFVRPRMPDTASMVGMLVDPPKPLPHDLLDDLEATKNTGVILVSFGSWMDDLPTYVLDKLLDAFAMLDERVYFKYGNEIKRVIPDNVRVMKWMPQPDMLAHPSIRLFVTHCGINGLVEAVYNGVPMLAMPLNLDQYTNAAIIRHHLYGVSIAFHDFTSASLAEAARHVIDTPVYRESAQRGSRIYRDLRETRANDSVYLMEHVLIHGSRHLHSHALDMPMYQYLMFDVLAILSIAVICILSISLCILWLCISKTCKILGFFPKQDNPESSMSKKNL